LPESVIGKWVEFEHMRKQALDLLRDMELSNFANQYGARNEPEFRDKLRKLATLLTKIEDLLGPPEPIPQQVT